MFSMFDILNKIHNGLLGSNPNALKLREKETKFGMKKLKLYKQTKLSM